MVKTTKKKEESIIEKVAHAAEHVVEEIGEAVEHVVESAAEGIEKAIESVADDDDGEKERKAKKKTTKKKEEKESDSAETQADEVEKKAKPKKEMSEAMKAKLKAIEGKFKDIEKIDIKEKVTGEKSEPTNTLVPIEDYLKASMHLGPRVITPNMRKYIYKRRADGLAVFNTAMLDTKMREAGAFLSKFAPEDIIIVCKREAGWRAVKLFSDLLGIRSFMKKYPAGILTNTNLSDFFECKLVFICDPWLDKNALMDANRVGIPVMSICDSNNYAFGIDQIVAGNNKSAKSLGMIMYLLAKLYIEHRKLDVALPTIDKFIDDWENLIPPK
ncbi:30S ribosomal protein S2 [Candidatus Pacearchaeota archaeon]|nr:30S ribosomal protein S2 [Candidatus Pacearchaeota archaeon]